MLTTFKILLFFCIATLAISCSSVKKTIQKNFDKQFYFDTGYSTLGINLQPSEPDSLCTAFLNQGYIDFYTAKWRGEVDTFFTGFNKQLAKELIDQSVGKLDAYDTRYIIFGTFKYFSLKKVKLAKYRFLNSKKDTVVATFKFYYNVSPVFTFRPSPVSHDVIFKKNTAGGWKAINLGPITESVYTKNPYGGIYLYNVLPSRSYTAWRSKKGYYLEY